jgi:hypothetical protein
MENEVDVLIVSSRIENKRTFAAHPRRPARKHILSVDRSSSAGISRDPSARHHLLRSAFPTVPVATCLVRGPARRK